MERKTFGTPKLVFTILLSLMLGSQAYATSIQECDYIDRDDYARDYQICIRLAMSASVEGGID